MVGRLERPDSFPQAAAKEHRRLAETILHQQPAVAVVAQKQLFVAGSERARGPVLGVDDERCTVIGRAHYLDSNPQYMVRYVAADGRMTECWWAESALVTTL